MNRVSHVILSLLLITATTGVTISKHYCGNILRDVSIIESFDKCCDKDEMPMGCCHDEHESFSVENDYQNQEFSFDQKLVLINSFARQNYIDLAVLPNSIFKTQSYQDPPHPLPEQRPIYLQVQSFLI